MGKECGGDEQRNFSTFPLTQGWTQALKEEVVFLWFAYDYMQNRGKELD